MFAWSGSRSSKSWARWSRPGIRAGRCRFSAAGARLAAGLKEEGWQAIKLRLHHPTLNEDVATVERVRDAIGDVMTIMVDANQAQSSGNWQPGILWDYRRALETARELQRLGCY